MNNHNESLAFGILGHIGNRNVIKDPEERYFLQKAVRKMIPQKAKHNDSGFPVCPSCGWKLCNMPGTVELPGYCQACGQAIKDGDILNPCEKCRKRFQCPDRSRNYQCRDYDGETPYSKQ